jgi:hypothetical protein
MPGNSKKLKRPAPPTLLARNTTFKRIPFDDVAEKTFEGQAHFANISCGRACGDCRFHGPHPDYPQSPVCHERARIMGDFGGQVPATECACKAFSAKAQTP